MHSLRRAALRSALSASRAVSTSTRLAPLATRAAAVTHATKTSSLQTVRLFSQTPCRSQTDDKELEKAQAQAEQEMEKQIAEDARQDVEESVAQTEADIQEAMQEVTVSATKDAQQPVEEYPKESSAQQARDAFQEGAQPEGSSHETSAFIRNIVFEVTEEHLVKAFEKYGPVKTAFVARDPRGLSKGYGFVTFETAEALQAACANVNGSFWHGRRVTCIPRAKERAPKHSGFVGTPTSQLFVGNIPYETTDTELNRLFRSLENLKDVRVAVDRTTGWPRGFAHADFTSVDAAIAARAKLDGAMLGGRKLRVDFAEGYQRKERRPRQE